MQHEEQVRVEAQAVANEAASNVVCILPEAAPEALAACPNCRRVDTLILAGDVFFCAACGYASDGARGCT